MVCRSGGAELAGAARQPLPPLQWGWVWVADGIMTLITAGLWGVGASAVKTGRAGPGRWLGHPVDQPTTELRSAEAGPGRPLGHPVDQPTTEHGRSRPRTLFGPPGGPTDDGARSSRPRRPLGHPVDEPATEPPAVPNARWATRWTNRRRAGSRLGRGRPRPLVGPPGGPTDDGARSEPASDAVRATRWTNRRRSTVGAGPGRWSGHPVDEPTTEHGPSRPRTLVGPPGGRTSDVAGPGRVQTRSGGRAE